MSLFYFSPGNTTFCTKTRRIRMKMAITAVVAVLVTAGVMFFVMKTDRDHQARLAKQAVLVSMQKSVEKRLADLSAQIESQLESFADVVVAHKDFSLRILVENDRSSPVVTEMAGQFLKPMGFSVLEITDSAWSILSSGHFPASAGNKSVLRGNASSGKVNTVVADILGTPTLTLQTERGFTIAGIVFHVTGGLTIDNALLARLSPAPGVTVLLKNGGEYIGMDNIRSISAINDHQIIINDKKYPSAEIAVPSGEGGEKVSLIVVLMN